MYFKQLGLRSLFIFSLLFLSQTAFSLGLGEITVYSRLNEPLKAEITLLNITEDTALDEITVKNADRNIYSRFGLVSPDSLSHLKVQIDKLPSQKYVARLTTKKAVREPFLTFILELQWRQGRLTKEYTILLDPPELVQKASRYKEPEQKKKERIAPRPEQAITLQKQKADTPRIVEPVRDSYVSSDKKEYGPTRRNDTLWEIANRLKPKGASTWQTMNALFEYNPQAFINNNIDLLKTDQTLYIPTLSEIKTVAQREKTKDTEKPAITSQPEEAQQPDRSISAEKLDEAVQAEQAAKEKTVDEQPRLEILPPPEELINRPVKTEADLELVQRALETSLETVELLHKENDLLKQQIDQLTAQLQQLEQKSQLLDDKIAVMQQLSDSESHDKIDDSLDNEAQFETGLEVAGNYEEGSGNEEEDIVTVESELAANDKKPERSFIRQLIGSPLAILALLIIVLTVIPGIILLVRSRQRRRRYHSSQPQSTVDDAFSNKTMSQDGSSKDMDFFEYFEQKINQPDKKPVTTPQSAKGTKQPLKESTKPILSDEYKTPVAKEIVETEDFEESDQLLQETEFTLDEIPETELDFGEARYASDIMSEVDTYMAYGNYAQAEEILRDEMKTNPENKEYLLKLFECLATAGKRYEFMKLIESASRILNSDIVLRHSVENIYLDTWDETLNINKFT